VAAEDDGDGEAVDEMDLHRAGGAPPPVVPALKKGAKGAIHKKRA
jgi:hypothetical protein